MKSKKEFKLMLVQELESHWQFIARNQNIDYYNLYLGDVSFLVAGLFEHVLREQKAWNTEKWLDDSLLTECVLNIDNLILGGVMISGIEGTTVQWTEPFNLEIGIEQDKLKQTDYLFKYGDKNSLPITYSEFNNNRDHWRRSVVNEWEYVIQD